MALAQQVRLDAAKRNVQGHDLTIVFGYSVFAILFLVAIYFAASGPGTTPADLAMMGAFP